MPWLSLAANIAYVCRHGKYSCQSLGVINLTRELSITCRIMAFALSVLSPLSFLRN